MKRERERERERAGRIGRELDLARRPKSAGSRCSAAGLWTGRVPCLASEPPELGSEAPAPGPGRAAASGLRIAISALK